MVFDQPIFNHDHDAARRVGRRGGRTYALNVRLRKLAAPATPEPAPPAPKLSTAHEASLLLDQKFPWLRGAWPARRRAR